MGVNIVEFGGKKIVDMTTANVTEDALTYGTIAFGADGNPVVGTMVPVLYTEQDKTDAEKAQARANIGAVAADENIATATKLQTSSSGANGTQGGLHWCVCEWTLAGGWTGYSATFAIVDSGGTFNGLLAVRSRNGSTGTVNQLKVKWIAANETPPTATASYEISGNNIIYRLYITLATYQIPNVAKMIELGAVGALGNTIASSMSGTVWATSNSVAAQYADSAGQATKDSNGNVIADTYVKKSEVTSGVFTAKATLSVSGWVEDIGDYTWRWHQTIAVDGILETDEPLIDLYLNGLTEEQEDAVAESWAYVVKITTSTNAITAYVCDLPEVDIPIKIKEVR